MRGTLTYSSAVVLIVGSAGLALSMVGHETGTSFAAVASRWSADPAVWFAELGLGACTLLVGVFGAVKLLAGSATTGRYIPWFGLGILALGLLSVAVGWVGFRVEAYGVDVLERGELIYIFGGVVASIVGFLATFISVASNSGLD